MLERLLYGSKVRTHVTMADTSVCEDDIRERYNVVPAQRDPFEVLYLDPGGFAFSDTEAIIFDVQGIQVSVKPEHLYAIDSISTRVLPCEEWVKVYMNYACVVIPMQLWGEILSVIYALNSVHADGRDLLRERAKDIPFVKIK